MTIDLEKQNRTKTKKPLPAGWYIVGDPCYSFSNENDDGAWMRWLDDCWEDTDANAVKIMDGYVDGFRVAASGTEHGDGTFTGSDNVCYDVDAGLLGAVPLNAAYHFMPEHHGLTPEEFAEKTGTSLTYFPEPFHISFEEGTTVVIGHVSIDTGWGPDEDGEDEGDIWSDDSDDEDDL